jgi:hypothetical protein
LKTKNLRHFRFRTIRQIRTKARVETHIEHAENQSLTLATMMAHCRDNLEASRRLAEPTKAYELTRH